MNCGRTAFVLTGVGWKVQLAWLQLVCTPAWMRQLGARKLGRADSLICPSLGWFCGYGCILELRNTTVCGQNNVPSCLLPVARKTVGN